MLICSDQVSELRRKVEQQNGEYQRRLQESDVKLLQAKEERRPAPEPAAPATAAPVRQRRPTRDRELRPPEDDQIDDVRFMFLLCYLMN